MGVRQIRYCDISGTEHDVESHQLHIDQMRIDIDLAGAEYRKLLELLRPYIDAGRVEASLPGGNGSGADSSSAGGPRLEAHERQQVRQWAEANDIEVPSNNRFKRAIVDRWREETGQVV